MVVFSEVMNGIDLGEDGGDGGIENFVVVVLEDEGEERKRRKLPIVATADLRSGYDSADAGGTLTLTVTGGTFSGSTYSPWKSITFVCQATDHSCILDRGGSRRVVDVFGVPSGTTNLIGLKITRGNSSSGAGIRIDNSDVTITNCLISDNYAGGSVSTRSDVHLNSLLFVRMIN